MRNAYALLGLAFILVFGSAYVLYERAHAPTPEDMVVIGPPAQSNIESDSMSLSLTSSAFTNGGAIPAVYTCDGDNINPPLSISGVPENASSLILVMDDPDIPEEVKSARGIEKFDHWTLYNLPADTTEIVPGANVGSVGKNGAGEESYTGPCPPPQYEPAEHRYVFRLYAVSGQLNFIQSPTLDEVEAAAEGMMIEKAELVGRYSRVD